MEVIYTRCAGLDVHKETVVACVRIAEGGTPRQEVQTFPTTTSGLLALADWCAAPDFSGHEFEVKPCQEKGAWNAE